MNICLIEYDLDNYQCLGQDWDGVEYSAAAEQRARFARCLPISGPMTPPEVHSQYPKLKCGDFWAFAGYFTFALPLPSAERVRSFLEPAGELIPFTFKGEEFAIFNCLRCVDCLDSSALVRGDPRSFVFFPDQVPAGIFKPMMPAGNRRPNPYPGLELLVSEVTGDPATEFKAFVEKEGLEGLVFRKIWSSEG